MTIAVGLLANGGVVLAADTQLTIQNFWKGHGGKIMATSRRHREPTGVCAITGATNLYDYLHGLGDDLTSEFIRNLDTSDKATAYGQFDVVLRRFYRRHVVPIVGETPDVQVLMAYQRGEETALWQGTKNKLIEQPEYGAVGIGQFAAGAWLGKVWKGPLDIPSAIVTAVFATAVAKESVDGCGKYTHAMVVEANQWWRVNQDVVNEIDSLYELLSNEIQPALVMELLREKPDKRPKLTRDEMAERIDAIRQRLKDATPESVKQWRAARYARLVAESNQRRSTAMSPDQPPSPE